MGITELVPLLLGATGGLVLSLLLNYAFFKGWLMNPKKAVPREDYDSVVDISKRNTIALETIAKGAVKKAKK